MNFLKLPVLLVVLLLAACTNNTKPEALPQFRIAAVEVAVAPGVKANSDVASAVRRSANRVASAYSRSMGPNLPARTLKVRVDQVSYKNAVASLLIGSSNRASGTAAVPGERPRGPIAFAEGGAVNGVVGAAVALGADKTKVDAKLAAGLAEQAVAYAYGQKSTPQFARRNLGAR